MSKERAAQLVDAGIWLRLSGDIDGARRLFERALKLDPENERASDLLTQAPSTVVEPPVQIPSPVPTSPSPVPGPSPAGGTDRGWGPGGPPGSPAPSTPSGIAEDWGRMTGRGSPPPQSPPHLPPPQGTPGPGASSLGPGELAPSRTGVMFMPGQGSPPPVAPVAGRRSPAPLTGLPAHLSPPPVAPVSPIPGGHRQTLPYAGQPSPTPARGSPAPRSTMMFGPPSGSPFEAAPPRQTLPFGSTSSPRPSTPRSPVPQSATPAPRTTLTSSASPPPRVTLPALEPLGGEEVGPPRSTQVFSSSTSGPLTPSELPEVQPMVIRIEADDDEVGPDALVEALREQVNAGAARAGPRVTSIVITDHAVEAERPPATPPLFPEPPEPVPPIRTSSSRAASAVDAAWNWSASPPPGARVGGVVDGSFLAPRPSPGLSPQASSGWDQRGTPGIKIEDMVGPDNALEFVSTGSNVNRSPEADREEVETLVRGARDLIDLDDHTGAMELISRAQLLAPEDHNVQQLRERSERTLLAMFESKLGRLEKVPRVMLKDDEIIWLNLDHRAGFVLAQIDGTVSFEDLFAVSGMSRLDTARILAQLVDEGVISRG